MRRTRLATCLWPGLPDLWQRGAWSGLIIAVGYAFFLNLTLLATLVWTEWLGGSVRAMLWIVLVLSWAGFALAAWRRSPAEVEQAVADETLDLFRQAQNEYLQGNWFESEVVVNKLLRKNARDVDAQLLLATIYRHTGRFAEALEHLTRLELLEASVKWSMEIDRERTLLRRRLAEAVNASAEAAEPETDEADATAVRSHAA